MLISPDGLAPIGIVGVSASCYPPQHHKVQKKLSSGTSSPGRYGTKGHKMVVRCPRWTSVSDVIFLPVFRKAGHHGPFSALLSSLVVDSCATDVIKQFRFLCFINSTMMYCSTLSVILLLLMLTVFLQYAVYIFL